MEFFDFYNTIKTSEPKGKREEPVDELMQKESYDREHSRDSYKNKEYNRDAVGK